MRTGYHALTFGTILGEVAHRVDGRPLAQIVRDDVCLPLGITSLYFGIPDGADSRVASLENDASILHAAPVPADSLHAQAIWPPSRSGHRCTTGQRCGVRSFPRPAAS